MYHEIAKTKSVSCGTQYSRGPQGQTETNLTLMQLNLKLQKSGYNPLDNGGIPSQPLTGAGNTSQASSDQTLPRRMGRAPPADTAYPVTPPRGAKECSAQRSAGGAPLLGWGEKAPAAAPGQGGGRPTAPLLTGEAAAAAQPSVGGPHAAGRQTVPGSAPLGCCCGCPLRPWADTGTPDTLARRSIPGGVAAIVAAAAAGLTRSGAVAPAARPPVVLPGRALPVSGVASGVGSTKDMAMPEPDTRRSLPRTTRGESLTSRAPVTTPTALTVIAEAAADVEALVPEFTAGPY